MIRTNLAVMSSARECSVLRVISYMLIRLARNEVGISQIFKFEVSVISTYIVGTQEDAKVVCTFPRGVRQKIRLYSITYDLEGIN